MRRSICNLRFILIACLCPLISCQAQEGTKNFNDSNEKLSSVEKYFLENQDDNTTSVSIGLVSNGSLVNGKLLPFSGKNFQYFDTASYLSGRAFLHNKVMQTVIDTYREMETEISDRKFFLMECANKNGGTLFPHKTHQNGLSVDFMMPLIKGNQQYLELDTIGIRHYFLTFDNDGRYSLDSSVSIDFETIARHILILNKKANQNGLRVSKVIIKVELKDELYASDAGKQLMACGIYVVKSLTPYTNSFHDDHYHIDFDRID